jgi:recombination protein RecA
VLDAALERKIVQKSGSYFSFDEERLGQGRQNATAFLREHPDVCEAILARIQSTADPDQIVSARLLPIAEPASAGAVAAEAESREGHEEPVPRV